MLKRSDCGEGVIISVKIGQKCLAEMGPRLVAKAVNGLLIAP
jgi:hypothetical protein